MTVRYALAARMRSTLRAIRASYWRNHRRVDAMVDLGFACTIGLCFAVLLFLSL